MSDYREFYENREESTQIYDSKHTAKKKRNWKKKDFFCNRVISLRMIPSRSNHWLKNFINSLFLISE